MYCKMYGPLSPTVQCMTLSISQYCRRWLCIIHNNIHVQVYSQRNRRYYRIDRVCIVCTAICGGLGWWHMWCQLLYIWAGAVTVSCADVDWYVLRTLTFRTTACVI